MQKNSLSYEEGDIVILELPFTNMVGKKLRPVVVLSSSELNIVSADLIVAKISSSEHLPDFEVKITSSDIEEGKLKKTSYIHCHSIFTVEKNLILKKAGKLKPEKLIEVKNIIKKVFNI